MSVVIMFFEKKGKKKAGIRFLIRCFLFFLPVSNSYALGIDFTEKADFQKDGSGIFSIKTDLTKVGSLCEFLKYLNRDFEHLTQAIGYKALSTAEETFKKIPGISQVHVRHDQHMFTFTLKFAFKDIEALNKAMHKLYEGIDPTNTTYFTLTDDLFVREDLRGIAKKLLSYQAHDMLIKSLGLTYFFKDTTYTTIYTFCNRIQDFSNPYSEITRNKNSIRVRHQVFSEDETEESISNRVHFEKPSN